MTTPEISVIIPTYNRKHYLKETLASLAEQNSPFSQFEVIVVDDGSTDGSEEVVSRQFPFTLRYFRQENQGDALARNTGVQQSSAVLLVFLDDDILVEPDYLAAISAAHRGNANRIVVGTDTLWLEAGNPLGQAKHSITPSPASDVDALVSIDFPEICSNNMSVRRESYLSIGMMQDLNFPGSSIWCDIDFSYRAYQKGFEFYRSVHARCWHRDYVYTNLNNQIRRWNEASYRAVSLFQRHPKLIQYLPMFSDKTPIDPYHDSPGLIIRKLARQFASTRPFLWFLESLVSILTRISPALKVANPLRRWIIGGYIYRGFRDGLRESSTSMTESIEHI